MPLSAVIRNTGTTHGGARLLHSSCAHSHSTSNVHSPCTTPFDEPSSSQSSSSASDLPSGETSTPYDDAFAYLQSISPIELVTFYGARWLATMLVDQGSKITAAAGGDHMARVIEIVHAEYGKRAPALQFSSVLDIEILKRVMPYWIETSELNTIHCSHCAQDLLATLNLAGQLCARNLLRQDILPTLLIKISCGRPSLARIEAMLVILSSAGQSLHIDCECVDRILTALLRTDKKKSLVWALNSRASNAVKLIAECVFSLKMNSVVGTSRAAPSPPSSSHIQLSHTQHQRLDAAGPSSRQATYNHRPRTADEWRAAKHAFSEREQAICQKAAGTGPTTRRVRLHPQKYPTRPGLYITF